MIGEGCSFGRTSGVVWHLCVLHVATSKNILVKDAWSMDWGGGGCGCDCWNLLFLRSFDD